MTTTQEVCNEKRKLKHHPSKKFVQFRNIKQTNEKKASTVKYFFYSKKEHVKKDCIKCKTWFEKKSINSIFVCFKLNIIEAPSNTWWIHSGTSTHATNNI